MTFNESIDSTMGEADPATDPPWIVAEVHSSWVEGNIHVVVATVAFGMGINKAEGVYGSGLKPGRYWCI